MNTRAAWDVPCQPCDSSQCRSRGGIAVSKGRAVEMDVSSLFGSVDGGPSRMQHRPTRHALPHDLDRPSIGPRARAQCAVAEPTGGVVAGANAADADADADGAEWEPVLSGANSSRSFCSRSASFKASRLASNVRSGSLSPPCIIGNFPSALDTSIQEHGARGRQANDL